MIQYHVTQWILDSISISRHCFSFDWQSEHLRSQPAFAHCCSSALKIEKINSSFSKEYKIRIVCTNSLATKLLLNWYLCPLVKELVLTVMRTRKQAHCRQKHTIKYATGDSRPESFQRMSLEQSLAALHMTGSASRGWELPMQLHSWFKSLSPSRKYFIRRLDD